MADTLYFAGHFPELEKDPRYATWKSGMAPRPQPKRRTVYKQQWNQRRDRKTSPVRPVKALVSESERHTPHGYRVVYTYELTCKHQVKRHQTCTSAACDQCPPELR